MSSADSRRRPRTRSTRVSRPATPLTYSLPDAAAAIGIGTTKLGQLIASGALPTITIGRRRLVLADDVALYLSSLRPEQRNRV